MAAAGDDEPATSRIELRPADMEDLEILVALARAFYDEDGFSTSSASLRENFTFLIGTDTARVMLSLADGEAIGFALSTTGFTLESGVIAELQDLYVCPDRRRGGIASLLISDALDWAEEKGAAYLEVVIAPNGKDVSHLFSFYESQGFLDEGRRILARLL